MNIKKLFLLAALALIAASCAKNEIDAPAQGRTLTLAATLPADGPESRMTYAPDSRTPHGLTLKWAAGDKLHLCFVHGGQYYHADTEALEASHITTDGKRANFTVTVPAAIPADAAFDFYAVYQKINTRSPYNGGYFEAGTANYIFEDYEEQCITLDREGNTQKGIIRPALRYTQKNATAATLGSMAFEHMGWVLALTFTNSSGAEMDLPASLRLQYDRESPTSFIWNGFHGFNTVKTDLNSGTASSSASGWNSKACVHFDINIAGYNWLPLYGQKLAAGASITLYRWVISTPQIEPMRGYMMRIGAQSENRTVTPLFSKTVQSGKVYHVRLEWDGSALQWRE